MKEFCSKFKYKWTSCLKLPEETYTHVTDAWGSHTWLYHLISTEDGNCVITNISILYGTILSDHIPVMVEIDLQLAPDVENGASNDVRWKNAGSPRQGPLSDMKKQS